MNQQSNPVLFIMQSLQRGVNSNVIIQQLQQQAMNNPQIKSVLQEFQVLSNQMKQSGMTPQQFVTQYAQQRGLPVRQFVNSAK